MGVSINGGTPKWLVHNGQSQSNMDDNWGYPLVNIQKAIENMAIEIVDFPIKHGDFPWLC